jgi:hypothetical protein
MAKPITTDHWEQAGAIEEFKKALDLAKNLLPPLDGLNDTQRRLILNLSVAGLEKSNTVAHYSTAVNLLMGATDQFFKVRGGFIVEKKKIGQIRKRAPDLLKVIPVGRV